VAAGALAIILPMSSLPVVHPSRGAAQAPAASVGARRRVLRRAALGALAAGAWLAAPAARGQPAAGPGRPIPDNAEVGRLAIGVFPEATLDGKPVRLGPGARIYDEQNLIRPPSTVAGERRVAFVRGTLGELTQVWLVTDAEYKAIAERIAAARRAAQGR